MNSYVGKASESSILIKEIRINSINYDVSEENAKEFESGRNFFVGFSGEKGKEVLVEINYLSDNVPLERSCKVLVKDKRCSGFVYMDGDSIRCGSCDSIY